MEAPTMDVCTLSAGPHITETSVAYAMSTWRVTNTRYTKFFILIIIIIIINSTKETSF